MLELLFLLLPIAAAYGWYMGRRSVQQTQQKNADRLSREYVEGVDFLLSNQQDKAVDLFLNMMKKETSTVDAHLTLGNLFRSRGEVDRAIRIHQMLIENTSLTFEQRLLASYQLGRDYMTAGLYDRAESMFIRLTDEHDFCIGALQQLLLIYQAMKEWLKAVEVAEKLIKLGKEEQRIEAAHFYCELALEAMNDDDVNKAQHLLKKAALVDKKCVRASMMLGQVYIANGEWIKAVDSLQRVLQQDKDIVSEVLPLLQGCYQHLQQIDNWTKFLHRCVKKNTGTAAELMMAELIEQKEGRNVAQAYINKQLQQYPTMRLFYRLMDYHLADAEEGSARESLLLLRDMVGKQIDSKPTYRCHKCGLATHSIYWHCPSCRSWASVKPIRGLDGQ